MFSISKSFSFCAAHRLEGHPKCGRLHGHNYSVDVTVSGGMELNGMVLDYGLLKQWISPLFDELDHKYIVSQQNIAASDPYYMAAINSGRGEDIEVLDIPFSTAECLSKYFTQMIRGILKHEGYGDLEVLVSVSETPNTSACWLESDVDEIRIRYN